MSTLESEFMKNQITYMIQEMELEFGEDNEEQNTFGPEMYNTFEDDMSVTTRSQSLSAEFTRLTK